MSEEKNVPNIRFKGFTDPWEQRKLGEITTSYSGGTPAISNKKLYGGEIPFIRSSEINSKKTELSLSELGLRNSSAKLVRKGIILYALYGATSGEVGISRINGAINQAILAIQPSEGYISGFIAQWLKLNKQRIVSKYLQGGQGNLSGTIIKKLSIIIPKKEEQIKVCESLQSIDTTIALHQQKVTQLKELKKLLMQKIFDQEWRFKGFTDPWEQRKFEYLLDENDGIRRGPFGSALKKECFVPQSDYVVYEQQNAIYNKYETRYNITKDKFEELKKFELKPEDFIMSGAGTIGRISRVPHGINKGVFNQALIRFRIDNRITDFEYFLQFIRADFMQKKLTSTNPGSAITNLVPMSEVKKWNILVPQKNEQSKIGFFFKQLDDTITLHQQKVDQLKELKKYLMQNLFV